MAGWLSCRRALLPGLAFAGVWLLPWPLTIEAAAPSAKLDFSLPKSTTLATARTRSPQFEALKSMSHPGAREALDRLARSQDQDVRSLAQNALGGR